MPKYEKIDFSFDEFQKGLRFFSDQEKGPYCQAPCKKGGGPPFCKIRPCAEERGVEICFECEEFPCKAFSLFLEKHPEIVEQQERFREIGMDRWLASEEEKSKRGYARATGKYYAQATKKR